MAAVRVTMRQEVAEGATAILTTVIRDHLGNALGADDLDSLTLTLYTDLVSGVVNSRDDVDILNANGGVLDDNGELMLRLDPDDTVIVDDTRITETRVALLTWVWTVSAVEYTGRSEMAIVIRNTQRVPATWGSSNCRRYYGSYVCR